MTVRGTMELCKSNFPKIFYGVQQQAAIRWKGAIITTGASGKKNMLTGYPEKPRRNLGIWRHGQ